MCGVSRSEYGEGEEAWESLSVARRLWGSSGGNYITMNVLSAFLSPALIRLLGAVRAFRTFQKFLELMYSWSRLCDLRKGLARCEHN